MRLLVLGDSPPDSSRSLSPKRSTAPQPPGPGFPLHAPSVKISTWGSSAILGDELAGKLEDHLLGFVLADFLVDVEPFGQLIDHLTDQNFRRRGARGESHGGRRAKPVPIDFGGSL